jgi:hypothetical protein
LGQAAAGVQAYPLPEVTRSPSYRADIPMLAAMFRYAMANPRRANLLAFLRISVATWARPDAALDASTGRGQWNSQRGCSTSTRSGAGRRRSGGRWFPSPNAPANGSTRSPAPSFLEELSKSTWRRMQAELGIPFEGEGGMKLVRRSMMTLARKRLGEEHWIQGRMMAGHVPMTVSDIYALPDPANLGRALAVTKAIIDEIDQLAPGAFYRDFTAHDGKVVELKATKNG